VPISGARSLDETHEGFPVTDEATAHLTPAQHDHINFYGTYDFDIDAELRREGQGPLRVAA
jgi:hypothetical protein